MPLQDSEYLLSGRYNYDKVKEPATVQHTDDFQTLTFFADLSFTTQYKTAGLPS